MMMALRRRAGFSSRCKAWIEARPREAELYFGGNMDLGLTGKTALVLGASGGLGRAIALALAREGASVALAGRRIGPLEELASDIQSRGTRAIPVLWDLSDLDAIERVASTTEKDLGGIDILINNTGGPPPGPASGVVDQDIEIGRAHV